MPFSPSEINVFISDIKQELKNLLRLLEDYIIEGRDGSGIPIYLTKYRIKSIDSIYLKTKRHNIDNLKEIKDYAGLRVLCLFEKDILKVHEFLLKIFTEKNFPLKDFRIYNWEDSVQINSLKKSLSSHFPRLSVDPSNKESGYKSLHYIIERDYPVEIQLRTLLQDVWSELEHTLSYKRGAIHPHIKKSFRLLARDLETSDSLLTHLREINEKEMCAEMYSNEKACPKYYFDYEDDLMPTQFKKEQFLSTYNSYNKTIHELCFQDKKNLDTQIQEARKYLTELTNIFSGTELVDNSTVTYWVKMEEAFLLFCESKHDEALEVYDEMNREFPGRYIVNFRSGELHLLKGETEKALEAFDECEKILSTRAERDYLNIFRIKSYLALAYWSLGHEYIDIAIKEISQAEQIYREKPGILTKDGVRKLVNNIAWYYLEKYIITHSEDDFLSATEKHDTLIKTIDHESSSHDFDTVAWYCYHAYLKTEDRNYLDCAKRYCREMREKIMYTSFNFRSINIHINHIQEIMNTK